MAGLSRPAISFCYWQFRLNFAPPSVAAPHGRGIRATLESMPVWSKASRASQTTASTQNAARESADATQTSVHTTNALQSTPPPWSPPLSGTEQSGTEKPSTEKSVTAISGTEEAGTEKSSTEKKAAVSVGQGHPEGSEEFEEMAVGTQTRHRSRYDAALHEDARRLD